MVGIDQNVYSDFALQWLLDEYADDGDEIVCVHVTDKDANKMDEKAYKAKAEAMVDRIKIKVPNHRAISIKLEFAVGKLHATFQKLVSGMRSLRSCHAIITQRDHHRAGHRAVANSRFPS